MDRFRKQESNRGADPGASPDQIPAVGGTDSDAAGRVPATGGEPGDEAALAGAGSTSTKTPGPSSPDVGLPQESSDPDCGDARDLMPARMVNEYVYCPRLFYLEHVQGEFADNTDTVDGRFRHRNVDRESGGRRGDADSQSEEGGPSDTSAPFPDDEASRAGESIRSTSVMLSAPELGAIAKVDMIEEDAGVVVPIDYKRGKKPPIPEGAWEPERVQVCLQGLILRENGYQCDHGEIYFVESKERVRIEFTSELVELTVNAVEEARALSRSPMIPPPLVDSPKCPRCSLVGICLPDETNWLASRTKVRAADLRRLYPVRDEASPVYLQEQGLSAGKSGDTLVIKDKGKVVKTTRLLDVSQLALFGNVQVSTQLTQELLRRDVPVCYFSYGGWFLGMTVGSELRNIELRRRQFTAAADPQQSLEISQQFVRGKILNSRTLIRRNHRPPAKPALVELKRLALATRRAQNMATLLGLEGAAGRVYFGHFNGMLRNDGKVGGPGQITLDFAARNRRPPRDPINCLLSYLYSILARDLAVACRTVGFDPYLGFLHQPRPGRPALALDLMEEFRSLIADSVALQLVNTGEIVAGNFIWRAGGCSLTPAGRRKVLSAYERRMQTTVTHTLFKYAVSYRRILEVQARLLARHLSGEIPEYPPFRTR